MATDFNLPELGENILAGDVLRVLVQPGDVLAKEQPVLELETDKATIEVPSSVAGKVKDIKVKAGDKVKVGQAILTVDDGASAPASSASAAAKSAPQPAPTPPSPAAPKAVAKPAPESRPAPSAGTEKVVDFSRGARSQPEPPPVSDVAAAPAAPSVRRMARELGVDINSVPGTGDEGRISVEDVKAYAKRLLAGAAPRSEPGPARESLPDFARWGEIERQAMTGVRRKTAEHLTAAWSTIPLVTQFDQADITGLEELRKKYTKQVEAAGGNLTVTAIAVKVVASALRVFPRFNASVDLDAGELILKKYVNIGIAVDTDRGLLVPVIRNADQKNIIQIAVELAQLSEKARTRKLGLEEMQGGCFSVSNLGGIGGTYFTPLVNLPEVAILGISRASLQPRFENGGFTPRLMVPLSLSYDHRVIDGADGIRFLRWVVEALEQPFVLALQG